MINKDDYVEIKLANHTTVGKRNKNNFVFSYESSDAISKQVSEAYTNGNPIQLTIEDQPSVAQNNFLVVNIKSVIGFMKEYKHDEMIVCILNDKLDEFNKLVDLDYEPCYRLSCELDDDRVIIPSTVKIICFDMGQNKA